MIYTTGYTGIKIEKLLKKAEELDALVIDVRLKAWSRNPDWTQSNLLKYFKKRYIAGGQYFGNLNYKGTFEETKLKDYEGGLDMIKKLLGKKDRNLIFLCMCKDFNICHRKVISENLTRMGVKVQELNYEEKKSEQSSF